MADLANRLGWLQSLEEQEVSTGTEKEWGRQSGGSEVQSRADPWGLQEPECLWGSEEGDREICWYFQCPQRLEPGWYPLSVPVGLVTDQPPDPLCYLPSRAVPEPRGDGTTEGTNMGPRSRRGAGQRGCSCEISGLLSVHSGAGGVRAPPALLE